MNRLELTEELIKQKKDSVEKTNDIINLKTSLHHWKTNSTLVLVCLVVLLSIGTKITINNWNTEVSEKTILTEQYAKASLELQNIKKEYNEVLNNSSLVYVSKEDLLNDLVKNYPDVSMKTKILILETILSESEKYGMNPLILYSLCYVESTFRHWLEHSETTIDVNGKKIRARAVGIGGVMWEQHKEELKAAGIAETRGDLFDIVTGIKAAAFLYDLEYQKPMHKSATYRDESALLRYFGGDFPVYVQRIDAKIATFTRPNLYRKR